MNSSQPLPTIQQSSALISPSRDTLWYIVAIGLATLSFKHALPLCTDEASELTRVLMITSGTLLGFQLTAMSVLMAISGREFMARLRKQKKFNNLLNQLFLIAGILALTLATGIASMLTKHALLTALMCAAFIFALVTFLRAGWKFKVIFELLD